ncbi:hypothetical protein KAFR_0B06890 [Kazachstania africana CBS 2517]|uniref:Pre-rRNA-processing protein RIX1 n=1 Tax=Kazachstania africana (strain ATCC 22294 / BCRC 22015 / CBS 2517 / CECT 1963 / NBRC 1671 / NRRL Y-8276) TaxID=1071382 RepID=H2ARI6_KAZAF|nr:hypothetical protein KAFR_0B06890 [Kazachstania africana CBS 2517]CCF56986.1 hypothetical protein KAFR_0B06890 [Kazachstania africana CBS 2517]
MAQAILPITVIAKRLELTSGYEFHTILKTLTSPEYVNEQLLKSELNLLNTKILKLLRSGTDFDVWKGCHVAAVVCAYNPLMLVSYGGQFLSAIYSKLEQKSNYYSVDRATLESNTLLETLISSTSILMDLMRKKPTLSRESLVPKLKAIIPTLINLCQSLPKLCLPVLKTLLLEHSTTFKPFANKYRTILTGLITGYYARLDRNTQLLISDNYAYLHLIKIQASQSQSETDVHHKAHRDEAWRMGLLSILLQFKPIVEICGNILDFDQDSDLVKLIQSLPRDLSKEDDNADPRKKLMDFLPGLKIDFNDALTLNDIPARLNLLVDLLSSFISLPTPYPVRVPIGAINSISEVLVTMTQKYLPIKRELRRDNELTSVINHILPCIQSCGINLWTVLLNNYGKSCLSFSENILASLKLFIPVKPKSKDIDIATCKLLKTEFLNTFKLINLILIHLGHQLNEIDSINQFIDISLKLTEDDELVDSFYKNQQQLKLKNSSTVTNMSQKKNQKKDSNTGALSDLYTHPDRFKVSTSIEWYNEINKFLFHILSYWKLPSSQQVKILRYIISKSLILKSKLNYIPESFVKLLRLVVINPGNERISILPIAVSLLKDCSDEVFDLAIHPRLPMSIIHSVTAATVHNNEYLEVTEEEPTVTSKFEMSSSILEEKEVIEVPKSVARSSAMTTKSKVHADPSSNHRITEDVKYEKSVLKTYVNSAVGEDKVNNVASTKRANNEEEKQDFKRAKVEEGASTSNIEVVEGAIKVQPEKQEESGDDEDSDSDFEIPAIELSDDEDE